MSKTAKPSIKSIVANHPEAANGRVYFAIGPNCWGKSKNAGVAIANCKKEFPRHLGAGAFKFVLFDCHEDTYVDDMGAFCYFPDKTDEPYKEVARYGIPADKNPADKASEA